MSIAQWMIDEMYRGNQQLIIENISSKTPLDVLNAIMAGTKLRLTDPIFLAGVWAATKDDTTLLNIPLSSFATAALHMLGEKSYTGKDSTILTMIKVGFP